MITYRPRGPFLKYQRAGKAVVVYMQDRGFNSFASNMITINFTIN